MAQATIIILVIILFLFTIASFISTIQKNTYKEINEVQESRINDQEEQLKRVYQLVNKLDSKNEYLKKEIERLKKNRKISESRKRKGGKMKWIK